MIPFKRKLVNKLERINSIATKMVTEFKKMSCDESFKEIKLKPLRENWRKQIEIMCY